MDKIDGVAFIVAFCIATIIYVSTHDSRLLDDVAKIAKRSHAKVGECYLPEPWFSDSYCVTSVVTATDHSAVAITVGNDTRSRSITNLNVSRVVGRAAARMVKQAGKGFIKGLKDKSYYEDPDNGR